MIPRNVSNMRRWLWSLDTYANATYGRSVSSAVVANRCVSCNEEIGRSSPQGAAPYAHVGLCERCQRDEAITDIVVPFRPPQTPPG
jgi:hypothetical protein